MKVVIFDELIEVDTKHLKANANMRSEGKFGTYSHDILAVLMVSVSEGLQYFYLDLSLLMELLPVLKDLYGHVFLSLMIKAPEDYTKGSPS